VSSASVKDGFRKARAGVLGRLRAEPAGTVAAAVAVLALIVGGFSFFQSKSVASRTAEEGQKTTLAKLVAEIVTLTHAQPATAGSEEAEIAAAEVALPLAEGLRASAPAIDFYEIGRALAINEESPGALRVLSLVAARREATRPRAFALREEAALLYRMRGADHVRQAEHDIYEAKHMFDGRRGEPMLRDIDHAYTDLFDAAEGPRRCVTARREILQAKEIMKRDRLQKDVVLIARREEARRREQSCEKQ
jgi:hypothetical protein